MMAYRRIHRIIIHNHIMITIAYIKEEKYHEKQH